MERVSLANAIADEARQISSPVDREQFIESKCGADSALKDAVRAQLAPTPESPPPDSNSTMGASDAVTIREPIAPIPPPSAPKSEEIAPTPGDSETASEADITQVADPTVEYSAPDPEATGAASGGSTASLVSDATGEIGPSSAADFSIDEPAGAEPTQKTLGTSGQPTRYLPPPEIPHYRIIEEIGRGGMGVVYKAQDLKLKRMVALKMVRGNQIDEDSLTRFHTEAEAVAKIQHPNVVQIFEVGEHKGSPYLALEFVDGDTLNSYVREKQPNFQESAEIILVLARAMGYAHQSGVVHRDLKPSNILVKNESRSSSSAEERNARSLSISSVQVSTGIIPKITDFGLAKRLDHDSELTQTGTVLGTPNYMAPEQARGEPAKAPADIYALGATLYYLLTHKPPFRAKTFIDTVMKVRTEMPVSPRKLDTAIPTDLEAIVLKCLEKQEEERYASAEELADDLRRYLAGDAVKAANTGLLYRAKKVYQRRKIPIIAGTISCLLLFVLAYVLWNLNVSSRLNREFEDRLADSNTLESLEVDYPTLVSESFNSRRDRMLNWIERFESLLEKEQDIATSLTTAESYGTKSADGEWVFEQTKWNDRYQTSATLVSGIGRLSEPGGPIEQVRMWLERTPSQSEWEAAWVAAESDIYREHEIRLERVAALYPLGKRQSSGLWEFTDMATGLCPAMEADPARRINQTFEPTEHMGLVMVFLPGGAFTMGSPPDEQGRQSDEHQYRVRLSPFFISKYEVSQSIWERVGQKNKSYHRGNLKPVDSVLWNECVQFCKSLGMHLPSEAQFEYANRGGTTTPLNFPKSQADFETRKDFEAYLKTMFCFEKDRYNKGPFDVGSFPPNRFGLHDMHGNVAEWCRDTYDPKKNPKFNGALDPVNTEWPPKFSVEHKDNDVWAAIEDQPDIIHYSIRGGAYNTKWEYVRCADRYQEKMNLAWQGHGFRPIRVAATK